MRNEISCRRLATRWTLVFATALVMTSTPSTWAQPPAPINIGSRLELLLDDFLIDSMEGLRFQLHRPRRAERVLYFDQSWENDVSYVTVFRDGDLYRMYYASYMKWDEIGLAPPEDPGESRIMPTWLGPVRAEDYYAGNNQFTCYAESRDGIHWTRPALGLVEFRGSRENNIIWQGRESHNFSPFIDTRPGVPADERYKAIGGGCPQLEGFPNAPPERFASADAIRWRKVANLGIRGGADAAGGLPGVYGYDSHNVMFWDDVRKQYEFYFRNGRKGHRHFARTTSSDGLRWAPAQLVDVADAPPEHFYTPCVIPYVRAPHIYVSFPMRYLPSRPVCLGRVAVSLPRNGFSDTVFMFSRDGLHFDRRYLEAFMRPGPDPRNWTKHSMMMAWGMLELAEGEISMYVQENFFFDADMHMRRAVLRTDGFVSVQAPYAGGEFVSKPIVFAGENLLINAETSAAGSIRVEIQDDKGEPLSGYSLEDCVPFYGDGIAEVIHFKGGGDVSDLAGRPVRLRFVMRDADLYSLRFHCGR